ncbi:MAG: GGDEF domain-containing protein [Halobacteriovoraceae bacterium]|nr:GGDEF domain-containing protein [Halobacteriovoraceae bacterium]MCB9093639.1 GGDEF domain-containing protein [Halobacteriovoraceae bacterium]
MADDNSTLVITNIYEALKATDKEASARPACLLVVGGELNGTLFDLIPGKMSVGRSPSNTVSLEFQGISRHHFEIDTTPHGEETRSKIIDLGSSNGTFVNNARIAESMVLKKNDIIKIGTIAFKYLPKGDPERLTYDKLHEDANTDGLTKCFNKTFFNNALDLEVKKSKVTGDPLSLIIFDLDYFKKLNDKYGHDAGDFVLKEMANIIRAHGIREGDIFARYGGEEFVVLLPRTNLKHSFEIAERLRRMIEGHSFIYETQKLPVTASIGVADYRQGIHCGTDLFKRADQAVYASKEGGRNQVNFYKG